MNSIHQTLSPNKPYSGILMTASVYACLVIHLSLYPYADWRDIGIGPFEYLSGPWIPIHQTILWPDIFINIVGYFPLGFLLLLGINRQPTKLDKVLVPLFCLALSLLMEAIQTFLPSRVPSKMDVLTNFLGGSLGCVVALYTLQYRVFLQHINRKLEHWLIHKSWLGMCILILWFLSILAPHTPTFSTGLWLGNFVDLPPDHSLGTPFDLPLNFILWLEGVAPILINYCFLMSAWMIGLAQTQPGSPRVRLVIFLIVLTVVIRLLDILVPTPADAWEYLVGLWLEANSNALLGASAIAILLALTHLSSRKMALTGLIHLLVGWLVTLLLPGVYDPEIEVQGTGLVNIFYTLQEAGHWVSELWPILALTVLVILMKPPLVFGDNKTLDFWTTRS